MMRGKRFWAAAALALSLTFGGQALAAEPAVEQAVPAVAAEQQLSKDLASLVDFNQGLLTFDMDLSSPLVSVCYKGTFSFKAEPQLAAKGSMKIETTMPGAQPSTVTGDYYMQETDKELVFYLQKPDKSWEKTVTKKTEPQKRIDEAVDQAFSADLMDATKAVQLGKRDGDKQSYLVTLDSKKVYPYLVKLMELDKQEKKNKKDKKAQKDEKAVNDMLKKVLANLGDIDYTITIDEKEHMLTDMHANLTAQLRNVAAAFIKEGKYPAKDEREMLAIANNSTLEVGFHGSKLTKDDDLQVPAEVAANAKTAERNITSRLPMPAQSEQR
ncbi:hypothetical protein SAMN02910356_01648 [Selenomonas sp. GACV-9]|uniref:hypothetical protein n=1 Tax=Selenomonas sp. GACV-9 TaxID=3158782 RepID=UPI0008F4512C|nr:hypothetical protein SAMN02910356_01648 [Selenomonas ruminantium]